jgi:hypothetical protein
MLGEIRARKGGAVVGDTSGDWPAKFTFEQFWNFTEPLEGGFAANCMLMVQDLQVATGMGITFKNKAEKATGIAMAKRLEWVYRMGHANAGKICSPTDVETDYNNVLKEEDLGRKGSGFLDQWQALTICRITRDGLRRGVRAKIIENINGLKAKEGRAALGDFDSFPADAQLCVASLTWGVGPVFYRTYPKFCAATRAADWLTASKECTFKNKDNTLPRRQKQQEDMMRNANACKLGAADPEVLHFPTILTAPAPKPPAPPGPTGFNERERESLQISLG